MEMFASSLQNEEEKEEYKKLTIIHEINDDCTHMTTTTATTICMKEFQPNLSLTLTDQGQTNNPKYVTPSSYPMKF